MFRMAQAFAHLRADQHERALESVLDSGRPLPLPARLRLLGERSVAAVAAGLVLRRANEVAAIATDPSLLALREHALEQVAESLQDPLASSALLVGLMASRERHEMLALNTDETEIDNAISRLEHALFVMQGRSDGALLGDETESALSLWILGERWVALDGCDLTRTFDALLDRGIEKDRTLSTLIDAARVAAMQRSAA